MNIFKLSLLFESVVNGRVDLTPYPELKKLVDLYKPVKINGQYIIRPDDFDSLLNSSDSNTKDILSLINRGQLNQTLNNSIPQYRFYNFYSGLRDKLRNPNDPKYNQYKKAFDELGDLLADIVKNSSPNKNPQKNNNDLDHNSNDKKTLENTNDLKNNTGITIEGQNYSITDTMLSVFETKPDDPNVMKYKKAMDNDDISLPDDATTAEGLVYTLFKKLKYNCTQLLSSQVAMNDILKNNNSFASTNTLSQDAFTKIDKVDLATLPQSSEIQIGYVLHNRNGTYYNGEYVKYEGTFTYSELTWVHRFINKNDKNNFFFFYKRSIASTIEVGRKYEVEYSTRNIMKADLFMEITSLKTKHKDKNNLSAMKPCSAMDELIDYLNLD